MKILYIDDDPVNRKVVADMLAPGNIVVDTAPHGQAGLDKIEQDKFQLILLDLRMPGMDGIEVLKRLRARGDEKAKCPVIVVTADTALFMRDQCIEAGADEFILKPVEMRAFYSSIGTVIAQRRKADAQLRAAG